MFSSLLILIKTFLINFLEKKSQFSFAKLSRLVYLWQPDQTEPLEISACFIQFHFFFEFLAKLQMPKSLMVSQEITELIKSSLKPKNSKTKSLVKTVVGKLRSMSLPNLTSKKN